MTENFKKYLESRELSGSTVRSYMYALRQFEDMYSLPTKENLSRYKEYLIGLYKPQTVNLRLCAINYYLKSIGKPEQKLPLVRIQQKPYAENVISNADYTYLKNCLKRDNEWSWYFVVRFFGATGIRVNELTKLKVEDVRNGHIDMYSKGGKARRVYIPALLQEEALGWLGTMRRKSGFLFLNRYGAPFTPRGISGQLKKFAVRYHLNPNVIYPHSFRHRFAKNFAESSGDLALLADLMGHENIETTRIYLKKTDAEQREFIDRIVVW